MQCFLKIVCPTRLLWNRTKESAKDSEPSPSLRLSLRELHRTVGSKVCRIIELGAHLEGFRHSHFILWVKKLRDRTITEPM